MKVVLADSSSLNSVMFFKRITYPSFCEEPSLPDVYKRQLMDPLAELVKIDPKSIGVGQYQHDVDQTQLKKSLDTVVMLSLIHIYRDCLSSIAMLRLQVLPHIQS